jgi:pSer/pThr/pTyr-binding forkhead associated (FHA) protein
LVKNGDKQGLTYEVSKPEVLIGRDEKCDIVLNDGKVSAQHAKIIRREGRFVIIDGPSRNGTSLNGVKISSSNLQDGDELKMGDTTLVFREIRL